MSVPGTLVTEAPRGGAFLISEENGARSRDSIVLLGLSDSTTTLKAGTVLGKITEGTVTQAFAGTGNGTSTTPVIGAGSLPGAYKATLVRAGTNVGEFEVQDPTGLVIGIAQVAVAFSSRGISFTISDGSTDFVVGDTFTYTVPAGSGKWVALNLSAVNGAEVPAGILFMSVYVGSGDVSAAIISRAAEVKDSKLVWPSGFTSDQIAAAMVTLNTLGIIARSTL